MLPHPIPLKRTRSIRENMFLRTRWAPGGKYRFEIDSAAYTSYYGLWNNKVSQDFTVKKLDQYGNLLITISDYPVTKTCMWSYWTKPINLSEKLSSKTMKQFLWISIREQFTLDVYRRKQDGKWTTGNYEKNVTPNLFIIIHAISK
jgi:hypothetical protein